MTEHFEPDPAADQAFADKLLAKYRGNVPTNSDFVTDDNVDPDIDRAADQRLADVKFTKRLLEPGERKRRERQQRREKDDRRQEGQDRWRGTP